MMVILGGTADDWGFIPSFLNEDDPRSVRDQFHAHYMGGWNAFQGFRLNKSNMVLTYPGDPPMKPIGVMFFKGETVMLYPYSWVMILRANEDDPQWEVARMN
jgi:hypothetical protein